MTLFRISIYSDGCHVAVRLNDRCIIEDAGVCETEVESNTEHVVQWYIAGLQGQTYSIVISNPPSAEVQLTRVVGNSGKDFGGLRFWA